MQGVLATAPLSGFLHWDVLWDDLRSTPYHRFTMVLETEIICIRYLRHRIIHGRNGHPDCRQTLD